MTQIDLLPCPFCNEQAKFIKRVIGMPGTMGHDSWNAVKCSACEVVVGDDGRRFRTKDDAAKVWNKRFVAQSQAPQAARAILDTRSMTVDEKVAYAKSQATNTDELSFQCEKAVFDAMTRRAAPPGFMHLATEAVREFFKSHAAKVEVHKGLSDPSSCGTEAQGAQTDDAKLSALNAFNKWCDVPTYHDEEESVELAKYSDTIRSALQRPAMSTDLTRPEDTLKNPDIINTSATPMEGGDEWLDKTLKSASEEVSNAPDWAKRASHGVDNGVHAKPDDTALIREASKCIDSLSGWIEKNSQDHSCGEDVAALKEKLKERLGT